jgi:anti-anti-sigma factor
MMVRVTGRLLVDPRAGQPSWLRCVERNTGKDVRIDLAHVTDIDASGLGLLAELTQATRDAGGRLTVVSASPRVRRMLAVAHLDTLLDERPSVGPRIAA